MTIEEVKANVLGYMPDTDSRRIVIEAINRHVRRRPEANHHCPCCGFPLPIKNLTPNECSMCWNPNYCIDCGQAIDWGEDGL